MGGTSVDYERFGDLTGGETEAQSSAIPANEPICHSPAQPAWGLSLAETVAAGFTSGCRLVSVCG